MYVDQIDACTVPNSMGPLTAAQASLLAAPAGLAVSYLPPAAAGSPNSPIAVQPVPVPPMVDGVTPAYTSNYPDSTQRLVDGLNPFVYLYGNGSNSTSTKGVRTPHFRQDKTCPVPPFTRLQQSAAPSSWWWLAGIAGAFFLLGAPSK
jgi:hypothetical protein